MPLNRIRRFQRWGGGHPFLYYTLPLVFWVLLISWGSLAPPSQLPQFDFDLADKIEHAGIYAILAVLMLRGWLRQAPPSAAAALAVALLASGWGVYLEFLQRASGYRSFDLWDACANTVGALLGLAVWLTAAASLARRRGALFSVPIVQESEEKVS